MYYGITCEEISQTKNLTQHSHHHSHSISLLLKNKKTHMWECMRMYECEVTHTDSCVFYYDSELIITKSKKYFKNKKTYSIIKLKYQFF